MPRNTRTCWHNQSMAALTTQYRTDAQQGLTPQEARSACTSGAPTSCAGHKGRIC
jgi:hypothetical protein